VQLHSAEAVAEGQSAVNTVGRLIHLRQMRGLCFERTDECTFILQQRVGGGGLEQWVSSSPDSRGRDRQAALWQPLQIAADFHAPLEGDGVCRRFPSSEGIHWYLE